MEGAAEAGHAAAVHVQVEPVAVQSSLGAVVRDGRVRRRLVGAEERNTCTSLLAQRTTLHGKGSRKTSTPPRRQLPPALCGCRQGSIPLAQKDGRVPLLNFCTNGQKSRVPWAPPDHQDATWLGAARRAALLRVVPALRGLTVRQVDALATDQQRRDPREETQSYGERAFTQEETDQQLTCRTAQHSGAFQVGTQMPWPRGVRGAKKRTAEPTPGAQTPGARGLPAVAIGAGEAAPGAGGVSVHPNLVLQGAAQVYRPHPTRRASLSPSNCNGGYSQVTQ